MSLLPISRSLDLQRLRDEGYDVAIVAEHVLLRDVPYVNDHRDLRRGTLVCKLTTAGDVTSTPKTHVMHFVGEYPCDKNGRPIENIRHASNRQELAPGIVVDHSFSSKPEGGYKDYYEKMSTYATIISSPAASLDPNATPKTFPAIVARTRRVRLPVPGHRLQSGWYHWRSDKLADERVAILGVGGTGSYLLDLVAKTPVAEIHLFDRDGFLTHNAFRAPGRGAIRGLAARVEQSSLLRRRILAVASAHHPARAFHRREQRGVVAPDDVRLPQHGPRHEQEGHHRALGGVGYIIH